MKEIGSEFWDVPTCSKNDLFPESVKWFLSGRSALKSIISEIKGCHSVALPSWCCDSMIKPFADAGYKIDFYPVFYRGGLVQEIGLNSDVLFLMDYFGYTGMNQDLANHKGVVIRDLTHSIFSATYSDADYYFGSLRKWCGVWTGGYAWSQDQHDLNTKDDTDYGYTSLREKAMQLKSRYIHGQGVQNKAYLQIFEKAEETLDSIGNLPAAERDVFLAGRLNVDMIKSTRRTNAEVLRAAFPDWLVFPEMKETDCPMFVPVLVPKKQRDNLRRYLIEHEIYCPVHWPLSEHQKPDSETEFLYKNELSLVCDQRYTKEDMNRIVETVYAFWKGI